MMRPYGKFDVLLVVIVSVVSVALDTTLPLQAIADAGFDDQLHIKIAESLCQGDWLGPFNNLTLAKGIGYSAFICASSLAGIPLRIAQQALFLFAGFCAARLLARLSSRRALFHGVFMLFALCPVVWGPDFIAVVRENIYNPLSLILFLAAFSAFTLPNHSLRQRLPYLVAFGGLFGAYYLTREEDVWLYPGIACLILCGTLNRRRQAEQPVTIRQSLYGFAAGAGVPALCAALVILPVWALNDAHYGVFRDNDFRDGPFRSAYGALARIDHDSWRRYVVWPKDARERAYSISPASRDLAPYFEGDAIRQQMWPGWTEIDSSHFMWSLRDAAAQAGHFATPNAADSYFRQLAAEINEACDGGRIPCGPPRDGLLPPFRWAFLVDALDAALNPGYSPPYLPGHPGMAGFLYRLAGLQFGTITEMPSSGDDRNRAMFARMTTSLVPSSKPPHQLHRIAGWAYATGQPISLGAGLLENDLQATLSLLPATDVVQAFGEPARHAIRFKGQLACAPCVLNLLHDGGTQSIQITRPGLIEAAPAHVYIDVFEPVPDVLPVPPGFHARLDWLQEITSLYRSVFMVLLSVSMLVCVAALVQAICIRSLPPLHVLALAVVVTVAVRLALVSYLDVAMIPNIRSYRYLSPAIPFAILLIGIAATFMACWMDRSKTDRRLTSLRGV